MGPERIQQKEESLTDRSLPPPVALTTSEPHSLFSAGDFCLTLPSCDHLPLYKDGAPRRH